MTRFRYTAIDTNNKSVHGIVEADSADAALRKLLEEGLTSIEMAEDTREAVDVLGNIEAAALAEIIADVAEADIPLDIGLMAAAREIKSRKVATALRLIAARVRGGTSLENALDSIRSSLPRHLSGLIRVASKTGNLGEVLAELSGFHHRRRDQWRSLWLSLAYPLLIAFFALLVLTFTLLVVIPPIRDVVTDFELELSGVTRFVFALSYAAGPMILVLLTLPIILFVGRIGVGEAGWRRAVNAIPFIGPAYHWAGIAELIRMMALFLRCEMTLDKSMDLSAAGVSDAFVSELAMGMSKRLERGEQLFEVMNSTPGIPKLLPAIVGASSVSNDIQAAMTSAADLLDGLAAFRISLVRIVVPMFSFLFVFVFAIFIVTGVFAPLVQIISALV